MYEQPFNPFAANLAVVKGYFKSGKVLAVGVLYIVSAVLRIVSSLLASNTVTSFFNDWFGVMDRMGFDVSDVPDEFYQMINQSSGIASASAVTSAIFSAVVTGLIAAGFILIYVKSRNEAPDASPKAGVTILYVFAMIEMILSIIAASLVGLVFLLLIVVLVIGYQSYSGGFGGYNGTALIAVYLILFLICAVAMFYVLFTAINKKRFYGSVRQSLSTVELQNKGATPYGVMCIINAVFLGFSLLSSIASISSLTMIGFSSGTVIAACLSMVTTVVGFVTLILTASIALGYKKYIDNMKYGYNGTPYGGAQDAAPYNGYAPAPNSQNPYAVPQQPAPYNDGYADGNSIPPQPAPYHDGAANPNNTPQQPAPYNDGYVDGNSVPPQQAYAAPVCPNCGAPIDPAAPFCGNCGVKL